MKKSKCIQNETMLGILIGACVGVSIGYLMYHKNPFTKDNICNKKAGRSSKKVKKQQNFKKQIIDSNDQVLSKRKENILALFSRYDILTVPILTEHFSNVSARTLRRDMNELENIGLVVREGSTKSTEYRRIK